MSSCTPAIQETVFDPTSGDAWSFRAGDPLTVEGRSCELVGLTGSGLTVRFLDTGALGTLALADLRGQRFGTSTNPDGRFRLAAPPGPGVLLVRTYGQETLDGKTLTPYRLATPSAEDRKRLGLSDRGGRLDITAADGSTEIFTPTAYRLLDLPEGAEPAELELFVERGHTATVRILDPDGQPLPGAVVAGVVDVADLARVEVGQLGGAHAGSSGLGDQRMSPGR